MRRRYAVAALGLVAAACATAPPPRRVVLPAHDAPAVLVLSAGLGPQARARAFAAGAPADLAVQVAPLSGGHSGNTVLMGASARRLAGPFALLSVGTISSARLEPADLNWRERYKVVVSRPPVAPVDGWGRYLLGDAAGARMEAGLWP